MCSPPGRVKTWLLCLLAHAVGKHNNEVRCPYRAGGEDPGSKCGLEESGGDKAPKPQPVPTSSLHCFWGPQEEMVHAYVHAYKHVTHTHTHPLKKTW